MQLLRRVLDLMRQDGVRREKVTREPAVFT
jgi:hypothetical protein